LKVLFLLIDKNEGSRLIKKLFLSILIIYANPLHAEEEFSECVVESAVAIQDVPSSIYEKLSKIGQDNQINLANTANASGVNLQDKICVINSAPISVACYNFHQKFMHATNAESQCITQLSNLRLFLDELASLGNENEINFNVLETAIHNTKLVLSRRYSCL
jgi:hypothetical protein